MTSADEPERPATEPAPYRPRLPSRSRFLVVGGLRLHVRSWGDPQAPPLVALHGSRDASATFQFLVDALAEPRHVLAPDWRGHGESAPAPDGYAFADYLADLDRLLPALVGDAPAPLLGHSLGGNVATLYAGLRPERVSRLVSLDGFGLPDRPPTDAPAQWRRFLEARRLPLRPARPLPDLAAVADRLVAANPRLPRPKALFLAGHLTRPAEGGRAWVLDPRHREPFAVLPRVAEWEACLREIRAPALWIGSDAPFPPAFAADPAELPRRAALCGARLVQVPEAGHNLHHDRPEAVARLVDAFLG